MMSTTAEGRRGSSASHHTRMSVSRRTFTPLRPRTRPPCLWEGCRSQD
jgi:hypothetical protein